MTSSEKMSQHTQTDTSVEWGWNVLLEDWRLEIYWTCAAVKAAADRIRKWNMQSWDIDKAFGHL